MNNTEHTLVLDDDIAAAGGEVNALYLKGTTVFLGVRLQRFQHMVGRIILSRDHALCVSQANVYVSSQHNMQHAQIESSRSNSGSLSGIGSKFKQ